MRSRPLVLLAMGAVPVPASLPVSRVQDTFDDDGEPLVNGEEKPLETWDYFHCPAGVSHVLVGAGDGPCAVLAIGARTAELHYPRNETARKYNAETPEATPDPRVAYSDAPRWEKTERPDWPAR